MPSSAPLTMHSDSQGMPSALELAANAASSGTIDGSPYSRTGSYVPASPR